MKDYFGDNLKILWLCACVRSGIGFQIGLYIGVW